MNDRAWFADLETDDVDGASQRIKDGDADAPSDWPSISIESGFATSTDQYHALLRNASLRAFESELEALSGAADRQLVQLIRIYDASTSSENELRQHIAEAITEGSAVEVTDTDIDSLQRALEDDTSPLATSSEGLLTAVESLQTELDAVETRVRQQAISVAPNLSQLAGPLLAARLIALAGGLKDIAQMPSSTLQLLGAESALFAHLRGEAPSPKHGLIFTHPAVRSAPAADRGTIARMLAGKLSIAARIDHYRGELEPSLERDLADRLETIRESGS